MSTILVDNLTGKTSAGDITVTSEGGAATQSLQQGLAKAWAGLTYSGGTDDNSVASTTIRIGVTFCTASSQAKVDRARNNTALHGDLA